MKTHLEQQIMVITVNDRLARFLSLEHLKNNARKIDIAPAVSSWDAWLDKLWEEISLVQPLPKVLSSLEALIFWEKIIQESSSPLFHVRLTAKRAIQAFNWIQEYNLELIDLYNKKEDCPADFWGENSLSQEVGAYLKWHQEFLKKISDHKFVRSSYSKL
jgi:hypothetical protein